VNDAADEARAAGLEGSIARLMRLGTYTAVALIFVGFVLLLALGRSPLDAAPAFDPATLTAELIALRPAAILWLGILLVLVTPAARVALAVVGFARAGDRGMAVVSILILIVVVLGIILGTAGG